MNQLHDLFQERLDEIESYLNFLADMEINAQNGRPRFNGSKKSISTIQQRILYAGVYLQLYNLVESTMSSCISAVIFAASNGAQWMPGDLVSELKREWVRSTARTHQDNLSPDTRLTSALALCDHIVDALPINSFTFDKGGGNWDDAAIERVSRRFGFELQISDLIMAGVRRPFRDDMGSLKFVKYMRNQLAHGSISFAQCAGDETVVRLQELKEKVVAYLQEVVLRFDGYIQMHEYLIPEKRPS